MSRSLLIATSNSGKLEEFRQLLTPVFNCIGMSDPPVSHIVCPEVVEDGATYFENCLKKAITYQTAYRLPVLADDSGLEIDGLHGAPGVHSARFGGDSLAWPKRWELVIQRLQGLASSQWQARFRCVLCYYDGRQVPRFFQGTTEGKIVPLSQGSQGFGYDPIFFSTILGKTFGEATQQEKEKVSHRGLAAKDFLDWARPNT